MSAELASLINYAQNHPFIQAVGTEGATNDAHAVADDWQDTDITYFTATPEQFDLTDWLGTVGRPTMYQHEENTNLFGTHSNQWQTYLVQFSDNSRIDLKLAPVADIPTYLANDSLNTLQWARDRDIQPRPTDDHTHRLVAPTQDDFNATLNEFYWCLGNVAKGVARHQFLYTNEMNNQHVRPQLLRMLAWSVACDHPAGFNPGAYDKYLLTELPKGTRLRLSQTYRTENLKKLQHSILLEAALMLWAQQQVLQKTDLYLPSYLADRLRQLDDWLNRL